MKSGEVLLRLLLQFFNIAFNQGLLLIVTPSLNLFLTIKGVIDSGKLFRINKLHRSVICGINGPNTGFMLDKAKI